MFEDADEDADEEKEAAVATVGGGAADSSSGAKGAETLPEMRTAVVPKGGNAAEVKARLLSMCKVSREPRVFCCTEKGSTASVGVRW